MRIETSEITERKHVIEVLVTVHQNGIAAGIVREFRRFIPDWEPIETTHARALRKAADWCEKGTINLRDTGGPFVART